MERVREGSQEPGEKDEEACEDHSLRRVVLYSIRLNGLSRWEEDCGTCSLILLRIIGKSETYRKRVY